jgi:hypothetical protein
VDSSGSTNPPPSSSPERAGDLPGGTSSPSIDSAASKDKVRRRIDFAFFVVVLSIFACISSQRLAAPTDPDVWWHIRTGSWILQHGCVPRFDTFSYMTNGRPWVDYTWLFDMLTFSYSL